jgi:hypothetical protein
VQIGASRANDALVRIIAYAALSSVWHPLATGANAPIVDMHVDI